MIRAYVMTLPSFRGFMPDDIVDTRRRPYASNLHLSGSVLVGPRGGSVRMGSASPWSKMEEREATTHDNPGTQLPFSILRQVCGDNRSPQAVSAQRSAVAVVVMSLVKYR